MITFTEKLNKFILKSVASKARFIHLFINSPELNSKSVFDYFEEPREGYEPIDLKNKWKINGTKVCWKEQKFVLTGNCSVHGYFVTDEFKNVLCAEYFSGHPFVMGDGGGDIKIIPQIEFV